MIGRLLGSWSGRCGTVLVAGMLFLAVGAPAVAPDDPVRPDPAVRLTPPSFRHIMGTDLYGRDVLSRMLHGARLSFTLAAISVAVALGIGTPLGVLAGYRGRSWDTVLMAIVDLILTFPVLLLAIMIMVTLGQGPMNVGVALTIIRIPTFARIARAKALSLRTLDFVIAARSLGCSQPRIVLRHLLPNTLGPVVVAASVACGFAIIYEGTLSFLGLGIQPPAPSWGYDLRAGIRFLEIAPWVALAPGACMLVGVLGFNLFGESLREVLEPGGVTRRAGGAQRYEQG